MNAKPASRQSALEARKKAAGLVRVCVWAHPDDAAEIRKDAAKVANRRARQARILDRSIPPIKIS